MHSKRQDGRTKWYDWYSSTDTKQERALVFKLDMLILVYAMIAYWIKHIDQSNLTNAYVAGMKEDLGFNGNQLVHLQMMYTVGAVVGQIPFTVLANGYAELMTYRFMIGVFEAAFFPGVHFVLGAWYRCVIWERTNEDTMLIEDRGDEIGRRAGIFYIGQMLGILTAGLVTSGTTAHLDGVAGLAGWRWMFIITALMTIPVGISGFFIWPGTPARPNLRFLTHEELALAKFRLEVDKSDATEDKRKTRIQILRSIFTDWKIYVLTFWVVLFWNGGGNSSGGYLLWLKSLKRYDSVKVNQLGSTAPALGIGYVLFINFASDLFLGRTGALLLGQSMNFIGMVILAIWHVPESAKWVAFNLQYFSPAMSSVVYSWVNTICRGDTRERSIILVTVNLVAQSSTAWTSVLVFKTVEAPRFIKGWAFAATCAFASIAFTVGVVRPLSERVERELALHGGDGRKEAESSDERVLSKAG
ncbi:hypothetical protein BLS_000310 [Venturia inaequalis]|uniref:Uncharacterized protein n=1 Tax=Venturia inaequalis TaxID=5025 RepID=A0A8H3U213_VENIN|nr:hypothetical protein BLS_000310 [Venturia inaequalis]